MKIYQVSGSVDNAYQLTMRSRIGVIRCKALTKGSYIVLALAE